MTVDLSLTVMLPSVITDPEDPKFDMEKLIESWTKSG
jgi:hypothetical protein